MEPPSAEPPQDSNARPTTALAKRTQPVFNSVWNLETVYFMVEGEIFVVIKKGLLQGESAFVDMFAMPSGPQPAEGQSAHNPIVLEGVKKTHFSAFLSTLYPRIEGAVSVENQGGQEMILGVLGLANMWRFRDIRQKAIEAIDRLDATTTWLLADNLTSIRLGEQYFVPKWVIRGYDGIVRSTDQLHFGALEEPPYNFDRTLAYKILHLRATAPLSKSRRGKHPDLETLLSEEIARAKAGEWAEHAHVEEGWNSDGGW